MKAKSHIPQENKADVWRLRLWKAALSLSNPHRGINHSRQSCKSFPICCAAGQGRVVAEQESGRKHDKQICRKWPKSTECAFNEAVMAVHSSALVLLCLLSSRQMRTAILGDGFEQFYVGKFGLSKWAFSVWHLHIITCVKPKQLLSVFAVQHLGELKPRNGSVLCLRTREVFSFVHCC